MKNINFLVVGVGGQGTILASNILAEVGFEVGYDVKKAEVHGMSQRGGSVNSHVRWGQKVYSPVIGEGEVDFLLSFERLETLRYLRMLRETSTILMGDIIIPPLTVSSGNDKYPSEEIIKEAVFEFTNKFIFIPTRMLAEDSGTTRAHNVVLLGALSKQIGNVCLDKWMKAIDTYVPQRYRSINKKAFQLGREFVSTRDAPITLMDN
jgi:indolepyruvate ferredoxin oxidoreductase beta subunit